MRKTIGITVFCLLLFGLAIGYANVDNLGFNKHVDASMNKISPKPDQDYQQAIIEPVNGARVDAIYVDGVKEISELKENAELIVIGKVQKQSQYGEVGILSKVKISKTIRGKEFSEIEVIQINNEDELLKKGEEYILLLGKQKDGTEDRYYIKGGYQGAFHNCDGNLYNIDSKMREEVKKLKEKHQMSKSDNEANEFELLSAYLEEN